MLVNPRVAPKRAIHLRFRLLAGARPVASFLVLLRPGCGLDAAWMLGQRSRASLLSGSESPRSSRCSNGACGRANSDWHSGYFILKGALTIDRLANRLFVGQSAAPGARRAARTGARDLRGLSAYAGPARRARGPLRCVSNDLMRRSRNEYLPASGCGTDPGRAMDGDADETAADHGRLAGMQSHPHAHRLGEGFILARCASAAATIAAAALAKTNTHPSPSRSTSCPP